MIELNNKVDFKEAKENKRVVVMFSADWCPDCRILDPAIPNLVENNQDFTFYHADRDALLDVCQEYGVFGIPSFITFHRGEEVSRFVSKDRKTPEDVQSYLNETREKIDH
ncbi:thioredoxin family protein [Alteribacillus iranensis]|uniref:Thiol-disulfide isomerase or thioredoxin n=1 Tax=Alteribacillus iranensis TaxID=930128 RepID=A0A1I2ETT0_9BACI|nr:thioredoxin family protein [Alteribacillus iranensis]SFE95630.1 Thiol-disulfide isomerase or thioredoxin [Alteribacillus iranensis]